MITPGMDKWRRQAELLMLFEMCKQKGLPILPGAKQLLLDKLRDYYFDYACATGTGLMSQYYTPARVSSVLGLDPYQSIRRFIYV